MVFTSTKLENPDFPSYITRSGSYIVFSVVGYYHIILSATFILDGYERQVYVEFWNGATKLASASDSVGSVESGVSFGNCAISLYFQVTTTSATNYKFKWGSFSSADAVLTTDTHVTIVRES